MLSSLPVETTQGYELMLMHAQKIPPTMSSTRSNRVDCTKMIAPNTRSNPTTPAEIIRFLPYLAPSHPLGSANARKAREKNVSEKDAALSDMPKCLVPYRVNKASTPW
ncbi:hypothetical protein D3C85_1245740 [compost metagenome]